MIEDLSVSVRKEYTLLFLLDYESGLADRFIDRMIYSLI